MYDFDIEECPSKISKDGHALRKEGVRPVRAPLVPWRWVSCREEWAQAKDRLLYAVFQRFYRALKWGSPATDDDNEGGYGYWSVNQPSYEGQWEEGQVSSPPRQPRNGL